MRVLIALCLVSLAAHAGPLEDRRADDAAAHARLQTLLDRQSALRGELTRESQTVAQLKEREAGRVVASAELTEALRQTQASSEALDALAREVDRAQRDTQEKDAALATALDAELASSRDAWSRTDRAQRPALVERMRALTTERDRLRASTATGPLLTQTHGDDPADLLAQADALRDSEDKVRRQLTEVQARLSEAKNARELEKRMGELSADESMFDEQDRRLRLLRTSSGSVAVDRSGGGSASDTPTAAVPGPSGGPMSAPGPTGGPTGSSTGATEVRASDHQPQLGATSIAIPTGDDVDALEKARAQLESLAQQLESRAQAAEARAKDAR
jgi:hypothetical protein